MWSKNYNKIMRKELTITGSDFLLRNNQNGTVTISYDIREPFKPYDIVVNKSGVVPFVGIVKEDKDNYISFHKVYVFTGTEFVPRDDFRSRVLGEKAKLALKEDIQMLRDLLKRDNLQWNSETKSIEPYRWKPVDKEIYWFVNSYFGVSRTRYVSTYFEDNTRVNVGNYFSTREEAEAMAELLKVAIKSEICIMGDLIKIGSVKIR